MKQWGLKCTDLAMAGKIFGIQRKIFTGVPRPNGWEKKDTMRTVLTGRH